MDFSQALLNKVDVIVDEWIKAVLEDDQIETARELTYKGIRDSLPILLQAMATMLSESEDSDITTLVQKSLEHGTLRAQQGYDAEEIAREYRLIRWVIFAVLEEELLKGTPAEVMRASRLINTALDEIVARCFKSYTQERLQELEDLQNQLKLTNQELTRLVRASKDNMSQLAHELKTPLTSIIGYSDMFLRQQRQQQEVKDSTRNLESIERVLRSGRQLLHLINDALEISRFDAGKMNLHPVPTDVCGLINGVLEVVEPLARAKNLELTLRCSSAVETVVTDPLRLQQVITNLVSNAIRYTEKGAIQLQYALHSPDQWGISVSDTGIGIPSEAQARIFDPYYQVAAGDRTLLADSTGLGLAIVFRLVKLMQGKIELVSEVGVGSTFTVILPLEVKEIEENPLKQSAI